jgi:hypothetical protein
MGMNAFRVPVLECNADRLTPALLHIDLAGLLTGRSLDGCRAITLEETDVAMYVVIRRADGTSFGDASAARQCANLQGASFRPQPGRHAVSMNQIGGEIFG